MKTKKILSLLLASIMLLGLITVPTTAAGTPAYYDKTTAVDGTPFEATVDGTVEDGWGEPSASFSWSKNFYSKGADKQDNWTFVGMTGNYTPEGSTQKLYNRQSVELYVRRGNGGVYLGVKLIGAIQRDQAVSDTSWLKRAGLDVSIGTYDTTYNVKRDSNGNELFRTYRLMEDYSETGGYTTQVSYPNQNDIAQSGAVLNASAIGFDTTTNTYTYEMHIPYDTTHILEDQDLVLSFALRDAFLETKPGTTTALDYSNAYNFSDVCRAITKQGGTTEQKEHPFYTLNPIRIEIDEDRYIEDHATAMPVIAPSINGEVSVTEWGDPVVVTNRAHANTLWSGGHWRSEPAHYDADQRAKVWLTNNDKYIYVAVTLNKETEGVWPEGIESAYYPKLGLLLSQKGTDNGPVQVDVSGVTQDQYTSLGITFDESGTAELTQTTFKNFGKNLPTDGLDWAGDFNAETGTYTYELRIPLGMTNIDLNESTAIAMNIHIGASNHGTHYNKNNNRYNIGGTAYANASSSATAAQGQCLLMTLNADATPEAAIYGTNYPTLEAALADAAINQTVTLLDNVTADEIMVNNGVTLDLAGHALTASTVIANVGVGQIVDSSIGEGIIKITKNSEDVANLLLTKDHGTLPLYDAQDGGYRFFTPTFESQERESGDTNKRIFGIRVGLPSEKAYDLLDDTDNYKVLSIKLVLTKDGDTQPTTIDHAFKQTTVEEYVSESLKDLNKKKGIMLTVTGLDVAAEAGITVTATASMAVANETVEKAY